MISTIQTVLYKRFWLKSKPLPLHPKNIRKLKKKFHGAICKTLHGNGIHNYITHIKSREKPSATCIPSWNYTSALKFIHGLIILERTVELELGFGCRKYYYSTCVLHLSFRHSKCQQSAKSNLKRIFCKWAIN